MLKNKYVILTGFGLLFIVLGLFREYFFIHVNNLMFLKYYGSTTLPVPPLFEIFGTTSYSTMYYLKYLFTGLSFVVFFGLSWLCLWSFTKNKYLLKWFTYSYLLLLLLGLISMLWGYFVKMRLADDEYTFSRWLMGIAQSPIPVLIFIAASRLNHKLN